MVLNRRVMASLVPEEMGAVKISKQKLKDLGFQFKYMTHMHQTPGGRIYYYSFDHGYMELDDTWCLVVKNIESESV